MELFKISSGGSVTDLSGYVNPRTYAVNQLEIYDEWDDGDRALHRALVRTRVSGRLTLGFDTKTALTNFLALLSAGRKSNLAYDVQAYCHNTGTLVSCVAFLDISGSGIWDDTNSRQWLTIDVTVTEV